MSGGKPTHGVVPSRFQMTLRRQLPSWQEEVTRDSASASRMRPVTRYMPDWRLNVSRREQAEAVPSSQRSQLARAAG